MINTHTHPFDSPFYGTSGLPGWAGTRKVIPIWILLKQETVSGSSISWVVCKSATRSRQITMPAPYHSVFYRPDVLPAAQPTVSKHWRHPHTRLTALFPGLPGWAGKVKPIWILLKQETVSGSGISWAICKSAPCLRQITTPALHHSVFYRPDALPVAQLTASKHWRQPVIKSIRFQERPIAVGIRHMHIKRDFTAISLGVIHTS